MSSMGHHAVFIFCVSDAHISTAKPSNVSDYEYRAFGEFASSTFFFATENQVGTIITPGREMGEVHASQPLVLPSY